MLSGTACIVIILFVRVIQQYCSKTSSILLPKSVNGQTRYFMLSDLFAAAFAVILLILTGEFNKIDLLTVLISGLNGIMLFFAGLFSVYAVKSGTMALSTMFGTAGLIVPCIAGIFLYDKQMSLIQWGGVLLFFASSYLLIGASKDVYSKFSIKTLLLLIGSLVTNGVTMMLQTVFKNTVKNGSVSAFSFLSFMIPALILFVIMSVQRVKNPQACTEKIPKKLYIITVISSAALFTINQLATTAADKVDPVILFTFINGGNTIIAAVIAALLFKEKFTVKSVLGILIGVVSLVIVKAGAPV